MSLTCYGSASSSINCIFGSFCAHFWINSVKLFANILLIRCTMECVLPYFALFNLMESVLYKFWLAVVPGHSSFSQNMATRTIHASKSWILLRHSIRHGCTRNSWVQNAAHAFNSSSCISDMFDTVTVNYLVKQMVVIMWLLSLLFYPCLMRNGLGILREMWEGVISLTRSLVKEHYLVFLTLLQFVDNESEEHNSSILWFVQMWIWFSLHFGVIGGGSMLACRVRCSKVDHLSYGEIKFTLNNSRTVYCIGNFLLECWSYALPSRSCYNFYFLMYEQWSYGSIPDSMPCKILYECEVRDSITLRFIVVIGCRQWYFPFINRLLWT